MTNTTKIETETKIETKNTFNHEASGGGNGSMFRDSNETQRRLNVREVMERTHEMKEMERRLDAGKTRLREMMMNGGRVVRKVQRRRKSTGCSLKGEGKGVKGKIFQYFSNNATKERQLTL